MGTENRDLIPGLDAKHDPRSDRDLEGVPANPSLWWKLVNLDPVLIRGAVMSCGALAMALGLTVSDKTLGAFLAALFSLMLICQAIWTRSSVTPNAKVVAYKPDPVNEPLVVEAGQAVSTDIVQVANAAADTPFGERPMGELPFPERVES